MKNFIGKQRGGGPDPIGGLDDEISRFKRRLVSEPYAAIGHP